MPPGVRQPEDRAGGIWNILLDRSDTEDRIYFPDGTWMYDDDYSPPSAVNLSHEELVVWVSDVQTYMRTQGKLHESDVLDPFAEEGFMDAF